MAVSSSGLVVALLLAVLGVVATAPFNEAKDTDTDIDAVASSESAKNDEDDVSFRLNNDNDDKSSSKGVLFA